MKLGNLTLFYISQILTSFYFWLAIAIPYLTYRGLSATEAFSLISIYNFLGVVFEYPTGILGDKFGYKRMLILSNFLTVASMIILAAKGDYWLYLTGLTFLALGSGFLSGNDVGLLKTVSKNIKKDTANYSSNTDFVFFLSSILGGFLSKISFEFALYVSASLILIANIPMYLIKTNEKGKTPMLFKEIVKGSLQAFKLKKLVLIFIFTSIFLGFVFTIKSIFGSLGGYFGLDVGLIGIVVGLGGLARSIAAKIYSYKLSDSITIPTLLLPLLLLSIAIFPKTLVVITALLLIHFLFGYINPKIDSDLHELANDNIRASLFSLRRLASRLIASMFLIFYGILIKADAFGLIFLSLSVIFALAILTSWKYLNNHFKKQADVVVIEKTIE